MNPKIAFFDIDGTLATNNHKSSIIERISPSTKLALTKLTTNDITCVIATGRDRFYITELVDFLEIDSYITCNGQSLVFNKQEIYQNFLAPELVGKVLERIKDIDNITISCETTKDKLFLTKNPAAPNALPLDGYKGYDVYQLCVVGTDFTNFALNVPGAAHTLVAPHVINIIPEGVSKAIGIEKMLSLLSIDKKDALAFGDGHNDIDMFKAVGYPIAMGNAVDDLKAIASYITDDVDSDGIYNACLHLNLFE